MKRKKEINDTFLKSLFEKKPFTAASTSYGIAHEKTAKQMYIKKQEITFMKLAWLSIMCFRILGHHQMGKFVTNQSLVSSKLSAHIQCAITHCRKLV